MIGLDTNVLVRYIMQDDARQSAKATHIIETLTADDPGFVTVVSMIELTWVLGSSYQLGREEVGTALDALLRTREIRVECANLVWRALRAFRNGNADFADCMIASASAAAGCAQTLTFDRGAARHTSMKLID